MRISDWSSDVCSSDLRRRPRGRWSHGSTERVAWRLRWLRLHRSTPIGVFGSLIGATSRNAWDQQDMPRSSDAEDAGHYLLVSLNRRTTTAAPSAPPVTGTGRYRGRRCGGPGRRSEEHTSELQSLMRNSY